MRLSYRAMQIGDIQTCVDLIAAHPVQRWRYGPAIGHLRLVWSRLLGQESFRTAVFEISDSDSGPKKAVAVGVSAFVTEGFVRRLKTLPSIWIGPELTALVAKGRSPLLSAREVADANSIGGLTAVVWAGCVHPEHSTELPVHNLMVKAFMDHHAGFRLQELIAAQAESEEQAHAAINSGALLFDNSQGIYVSPLRKNVRALWNKPHILGITRDLAMRQTGTWITELFHEYREPRIRFNHSQQRLLAAAMSGHTDAQLAEELGISIATVKTTWRVIYDRVGERAPEILPAALRQEDCTPERGKTKKYCLLFYLRSHPEELRPIAGKAHQC
jgi:hypothetical protein